MLFMLPHLYVLQYYSVVYVAMVLSFYIIVCNSVYRSGYCVLDQRPEQFE